LIRASPDTRRIRSSGNVFGDLSFDSAEAEVTALRAEVMIGAQQHWASRSRGNRGSLTVD
jgi:hypothetical protein